jgi:REP element-mobilizing transposase RayT
MNAGDPIAFFITWTVYGTHLQGDPRGWRRRRKGNQFPQPRLAEWRQQRLKHSVLTLSSEQREVVEHECRRHCEHRGWRLWAINARTDHVHAVVTAAECSGGTVRDQLKANATRGLRERWPVFRHRPVWTVGGDWECVDSVDDLDSVCQYVTEAQDRKGRDDQPAGASPRLTRGVK